MTRYSYVVVALLVLSTCVGGNNAWALPGYRIIDNKSADKAVRQYADDSVKFGAVIYQAELDKNLWRLALSAYRYHRMKPEDVQRQISFVDVYWRSQKPRLQEVPPKSASQNLTLLYPEAVRLTEKCAKEAPNSVAAQLNYGRYLMTFVMGTKKVTSMIKAFETAVALRPDMGMTYHELGQGLLSTGDYSVKNADRAIVALKKGVALDPRLTSSYFLLMTAYGIKKDYKNAKTSLEKYLELNPEQVNKEYVLRSRQFIDKKLATKR